MIDTNELQAAVERLRQYGDGKKLFLPYHSGKFSIDRDRRTLADAYLELGTRQPVDQVAWNDDGTMTLVVRGHVEPVRSGDSIVYIQAEVRSSDPASI